MNKRMVSLIVRARIFKSHAHSEMSPTDLCSLIFDPQLDALF